MFSVLIPEYVLTPFILDRSRMRYVFPKNMWRRADKPHGIRDTAGLDAT
jgi:hypothetical protein